MMNPDLFYKLVTANYYFVSKRQNVIVLDTRIISSVKFYSIGWCYNGMKNTEFLSISEIKLIADVMVLYFGSTSQSAQAWNSIYLDCCHDDSISV